MENVSIFWFRRDLRLHDNCALFHALKGEHKVVPIFIFDSSILDKLTKNDARVNFIHEELTKINESLKKGGSSLSIYHGKPSEVYQKLLEEFSIETVYTNHDYEPYAKQRDEEIRVLLGDNGIPFHTFKDQVLFEKDEVVKQDGKPYVVYTPYSRKWLERFHEEGVPEFPSEELQHNFSTNHA